MNRDGKPTVTQEQREGASAPDSVGFWSNPVPLWQRLLERLQGLYSDLSVGRDAARTVLQSTESKPRIFSIATYRAYFQALPLSLNAIRNSPEILGFVVVQWVAIVLGYLAWTHALRLIPDDVWNAIEEAVRRDRHSPEFAFSNLVLLAWTFLVVALASYPLGLCTAAMVAVNDLRASNESVTLRRCIAVADAHLGRIWAFTVVDNWITVNAILDRLPKKGGHRSKYDELLYYAWKTGTAGVVPALVNGRTYLAAGQDSLTLLRSDTSQILGLRLGFSAACWVVGVLAYIGGLFLVPHVESSFPDKARHIFHFYLLMAIPVAVAASVVTIILRPAYVLAIAHIYTNRIDVKAEVERDIECLKRLTQSTVSPRLVAFVSAVALLGFVILFSDQLGLSRWIAAVSRLDLH